MEDVRSYTPAEAGVISGLGRRAIDNAIDKNWIPLLGEGPAPRAEKAAGKRTWTRRMITEPELVWVYLTHEAGGMIPRERRLNLFKEYLANRRKGELRVSPYVILDVRAAHKHIAERAAKLEQVKRNIVTDPEVLRGEPVFKGTRVPVYDIAAALRKGVAPDRVLAAYNVLHSGALEEALLYAEAFPPRGRPRTPPKTRVPLVRIEEKVVRHRKSGV